MSLTDRSLPNWPMSSRPSPTLTASQLAAGAFAPADQPNNGERLGGNRDCRGSPPSAILACRFAMTFVSGDGRIDCHSVSSKQEELSP
jgi:hypothetical protein